MPESTSNSAHTGLSTGVTLALLGAACFSLKAIFVKLAYRHGVDAETLLALRMAYAFPCFLCMGLIGEFKQTTRLSTYDWLLLFALGFCGYYLSSYLDFLGLRYISAALERLILFCYPTIVVILSTLVFKKPFPKAAIMPMALCYGGIALAVSTDLRGDLGQQIILGCVLVFGSALSYAVYLSWSAETIKRLGSGRVSAWASCAACLLSLSQFFVLRPAHQLAQTLPVHGWAIAMALVSTVLPIWLVAEAMKRIGAGRAAMMGTLGPVLTLFFGWLFLGEHLGGLQMLGGALVILGVWQVGQIKKA